MVLMLKWMCVFQEVTIMLLLLIVFKRHTKHNFCKAINLLNSINNFPYNSFHPALIIQSIRF